MPYAVSEQMIDAFGDVIFDLSLNKQIRRGDAVRLLDHEAWQRAREDTGLNDPEIAAKIGLAVEQVTFIRNIVERRRFRLNQYRKLFRLGGGLRHREERYQDPEEKFEMSANAQRLRDSMRFDPDDVAKYVRDGQWTGETLLNILELTASEELQADVQRSAAGLLAADLGRGDVVAGKFSKNEEILVAFFATAMAGGVYLPMPANGSVDAIVDHARAKIVLTEMPCADLTTSVKEILISKRPAAADPVLLLVSSSEDETPKLAIHTHQTLYAALRAVGDIDLQSVVSLMNESAAEKLSTQPTAGTF